jgi:hypothetical protein
METRKTKLGVDHPEMLMSMADVAFTWKSLGPNSEAIDLLRACVAQQHWTLGSNHPHINQFWNVAGVESGGLEILAYNISLSIICVRIIHGLSVQDILAIISNLIHSVSRDTVTQNNSVL